MPGDRSLFRQVQVVLDYARERRHQSVAKLVDHIVQQHASSFVYYWRDRKHDEVRHGYSQRSAVAAVEMAVDLRLLDTKEGVALTRAGTAALDSNRFRPVLGRQVAELMERKNVGIQRIERAIQVVLSHHPPLPPTSENILQEIQRGDVEVTPEAFRRLLSLLGQTGMLGMCQRRIFLPTEREKLSR